MKEEFYLKSFVHLQKLYGKIALLEQAILSKEMASKSLPS